MSQVLPGNKTSEARLAGNPFLPWVRAGLLGLLLLGLSQPRPVRAHGDLHLQIVALTETIQKDPANPELYLQRGELNRIHQLWDAALADFETVRSLDPRQAQTDLRLGRLYLDMNFPAAAEAALSRYLTNQAGHTDALTLRGQARVSLDKPLDAARDFAQAIQHHISPGPELFIMRARALAQAGPEYQNQAVACLDEGIQRLGLLVTLQLPAIDLELEAQHYDAALQRLDQLAALSPRKETWLKRRGEILLQAGRDQEARQAFEAALAALENLPSARRFVPAMQALEKQLLDSLQQIKTPPGNSC